MHRPLLIALAATGLVAGACASGGGDQPAAAPSAASTTEAPAGSAPSPDGGPTTAGPAAPTAAAVELLSFSGVTPGGERVDAVEYAGRDVIIWLWAPW